jgi:hypothetical protein
MINSTVQNLGISRTLWIRLAPKATARLKTSFHPRKSSAVLSSQGQFYSDFTLSKAYF